MLSIRAPNGMVVSVPGSPTPVLGFNFFASMVLLKVSMDTGKPPEKVIVSYMTPEILIVGGGMIVHDQILPSLYHMQRQGRTGGISVCASRFETVHALAEAAAIRRAFPGQTFRMLPESAGERQPE